jgi:hypothetical protein
MQEDQLKDVYTPSAAAHQDAADNDERHLDNRGVGIWLAAIYCLASGIGAPMLLIFGQHYLTMVENGEISLLRAIVTLLPFPLILVGGIQLFRMRKSALVWFIAAVVIRAPALISSHWVSAPWVIYVMLAVYTWDLRRRKMLD